MLYLIGLGLADAKDLSLKAIEALKKCDKVYAETYTAQWPGSLEEVESIIEKRIEILERENVESDFLTDVAKKMKIALLVPGDPLSATTHFQLIIDARKAGVKCVVIHSSSILTAIAETGLQLYKFGRTTTLPKDFKAESVFEIIENNKKAGLHTLLLLDIGTEIKKALGILEERISKNGKIVVCISLGYKEQKIIYGSVDELKEKIKQITKPSCILIPGELNFKEEEALELWVS